MIVVGGKRDRYLYENFVNMLEESLDQLGWLDDSNTLANMPISFVTEAIDTTEEVQPNQINVTFEETYSEEVEMGSDLEWLRWNCYIEIFAESAAVGKHLAGDIRDLVKGKMPSIDRGSPFMDVWDPTQATPTKLFTVEFSDVESQRTRSIAESIRRYWWTVACVVEDVYGNENDTP